jgi:lipoprotein signal peptidase
MNKKTAALLGVGVVVFALDRYGKSRALDRLDVDECVPLLGDLMSFTRVESQGAALGLFADWPASLQATAFAVLSLVCAGLVLSFYRGLAPGEHGSAAALGAILAGVLSNALDRFRYGVGLDFLHLGPYDAAHLPDFNFADAAIFLGVLTLIVELLANEIAARAQERPRRSRSTENRRDR